MSCHAMLATCRISFTCRGQLHLGFLTAAICESLVEVRTFDETLFQSSACLEVEASGVLRQLYDAKLRGKEGCLSSFFQADNMV